MNVKKIYTLMHPSEITNVYYSCISSFHCHLLNPQAKLLLGGNTKQVERLNAQWNLWYSVLIWEQNIYKLLGLQFNFRGLCNCNFKSTWLWNAEEQTFGFCCFDFFFLIKMYFLI